MKPQVAVLVLIILALGFIVPVATGAGSPAILYVEQRDLGQSPNFTSIQAAVTAAKSGDTILVGPGRYDERITISKVLTLKGATAGSSKKGYPVPDLYQYDATSESVIAPDNPQNVPVVTIEKGGVVFDGFVVSMTDAGSYPDYAPTELVRIVAGGNLNDIRIENNVIGPNTNLSSQNGNAGRMGITISKWSPGTGDNNVYNLQIRNNKIFDAKGDGCGILMIGAKNTSYPASLQNQFKGTVIDNNEISGNHRSGIDFSAGVQGGPAASDHIRITNNIISANGWNSTVDKDNIKWGNGIVMLRMTDQDEPMPWASRYIDIEGNVFKDNEKNAIYIGPITRDVTIRNNEISDNGRGHYLDKTGYSTWDGIRIDLDETYQVRERERVGLSPAGYSHTFYDYLKNIAISGNTFSGNGGYGLQVIKTPLKGPVDARNNWWGDASGPENAALNAAGAGDPVSDNVRFSPWYADVAKTATVSAADGNGAQLTVSPANFTTIQQAINAAWNGDAVRVFPGTYDERIVINRSVTLLGATSSVPKKDYPTPEDYAYDPVAESIISPTADLDEAVVRIETSPVILDGFVIANTRAGQFPAKAYPSTHLVAFSNMSHNYADVAIRNNVIGPNTNTLTPGSQDGTRGRAGIALYGPAQKLAWNLSITSNKIFDAKGDGCGILLLGSVNLSTGTGLTGKYRGSVIDNNTIAGNHRSGIEFSGGVQGTADPAGHFRVTNNTISDNGWGSPSEKNALKYGNGIVLIHVGSDKDSPIAFGSRYVDIGNNVITGNEKNGIYLGPVNRDITITNNTIRSNGAGTGGFSLWDGVQVDLDEAYHNPSYKNYGFLTGILVRDNEINASGTYGVRVIGKPVLGPVDARNNWWGDASGPKTAKNPSGTADRVSDNVAFSPWYTSPVKTSASAAFPKPIVSFVVDPLQAMKGETFSFNATESATLSNTSIRTYQWNFGDGNTTGELAESTITHRYVSPKVHTITLTVTDFNGMTNQTTRQATVLAKKDAIPLVFNGTTTTVVDGTQKITVNATNANGTVTNTTTGIVIQNPGNGWAEMQILGNTSDDDGSVVIGNVTEVVLKSAPAVTTLDTSAGGVGEVTTSIQLALDEFVDAPIEVEVTEGANTTVTNAFQLAAGSGNQVDAVAYTMVIHGTSLVNSNLSSASDPVVLNMSVSEDWVNAHGGVGAIKVIRYSDDGNTREVLPTRFLFSAGAPAMYFFEVISENGCSIFGMVSVSSVPSGSPPAADAQAYSVSGETSDTSTAPQAASGKSGEIAEALQSPSNPPMKAPEEDDFMVDLNRRLHTNSLAPLEVPSYDQIVTVIGGGGDTPGSLLKTVLVFVAENIVTISTVIVVSAVCAFTIIWTGDRRQYWR